MLYDSLSSKETSVLFTSSTMALYIGNSSNDTKNEWYKAPEEFGSDVYALSDEYAEKFNLPKSNQAN